MPKPHDNEDSSAEPEDTASPSVPSAGASSRDDAGSGDARKRSRSASGTRLRTAGHVALQTALMLVVFFQLNYLGCRRYQTVDLSQNRRFTLSETSRGVLGGLGSEVRLVMAFLETTEFHSDVKGLLSEFDRVGGDLVHAEYLDLSRSRARISELRDQHQLQFSRDQVVILAEDGRLKTIGAEEMVAREAGSGRIVEFRGEEVIASALLEVTEQRQRKIYLVTGDRRADQLAPIAGQVQQLAKAQNARLESLVLENVQAVPEDADALFFAGNSEDLSPREIDMVTRYWEERQGGLVLFLDPEADTPNLDSLLREHGVVPRDDRILSVLSIPGLEAQKSTDVPVALMPGDGPTRELPALSTRLLGRTQSLGVLQEDELLLAENIRAMPLMIVAGGFWGETDYRAEEASYDPDRDHGRPDPLFAAASVEKGIPGDPGLEQGSSRLVVVGNPDVISPDDATSKVGADFTMAAINWVMNREQLMGITPRQPTSYTLDISSADFGLLQSLLIFLMPLVALVLGAFVWMRRRA